MWVIFFQDTPHFWLIGGETYRVGRKDCHVVIQDDRSISRLHLTICIGLQSVGSEARNTKGRSRDTSTPQPITLIDFSTYGTSVVAAGEEVEGGETQEYCTTHSSVSTTTTTTASGTGIVGLRTASSAAARGQSAGSASGCSGGSSGTEKKTRDSSSLSPFQLSKDKPYEVPVHRASWRQFVVHLGHHGAALRFVWVDVAVLCEDVVVEVQKELASLLRYCGVRQVMGLSLAGPSSQLQCSTENTAAPLRQGTQQQQLSQNTLSERSAPDTNSRPAVAKPLSAVLGGSGVLSLSQRTSVPGTPTLGPSTAAAAVTAASSSSCQAQTFTSALATVPGSCYNHIDFLVTSTVQPSTAVVGMLCRAVPIVTPAFFAAVHDRVSPQLPLPDPCHFIPPLSAWWCDLIQRARFAATEKIKTANSESGVHTADTSTTVLPASLLTVATAAGTAVAATSPGSKAVKTPVPPPLTQMQLSDYFAPNPRRRSLFIGVTFVVVQCVLYEEVMTYLNFTGAAVVWEDTVAEWIKHPKDASDVLSFSPGGFQALQSFFERHQRHVLLYNETEVTPFPHCLPLLRHGLGMCSVEYGTIIESIVLTQIPPLPAFPDNACLPQTVEEVQARVRLAFGEASSSAVHDSETQDSQWDTEATENDGVAEFTEGGDEGDGLTEGRPTNAEPLFPDVFAGTGRGSPQDRLRKGARLQGGLGDGAQPQKRPRKEDADGWVTLGKSTAAGNALGACALDAHVSSSTEAAATAAKANPALRTVDIHCSPYVLPPYPCFAGAAAAARTSSSAKPCTGFVKQALPPVEPLVELEEHRARRQLAASMLIARVPTVDADTVIPEQVVMGSGNSIDANTNGSMLASRAAALTTAAFNTFDTVAYHASSKRKGTVARRDRGNTDRSMTRTRRAPHAMAASSTGRPPGVTMTGGAGAAVVNVDDAEEVVEVGPRDSTASSTFHIFDIDGIF